MSGARDSARFKSSSGERATARPTGADIASDFSTIRARICGLRKRPLMPIRAPRVVRPGAQCGHREGIQLAGDHGAGACADHPAEERIMHHLVRRSQKPTRTVWGTATWIAALIATG